MKELGVGYFFRLPLMYLIAVQCNNSIYLILSLVLRKTTAKKTVRVINFSYHFEAASQSCV